MTDIAQPHRIARFSAALPFWLSLLLIPIAWVSAFVGGWAVLLLPLTTWYLFSVIDIFAGLNEANEDPHTADDQLWWYRLITIIWAPIQGVSLFAMIYYVTRTDHLGGWEMFGLFFGMGVITGTIGINYSHELMHQKPKVERWMADILLAMALYSHFRSEHLLVHHRYVGTPRDPVTARYNEGFHRFFPRVLVGCATSAFKAEAAMLARKGKPARDFSNPFWRYGALQLGFLGIAFVVGGWVGLGLFVLQAFVAIWHLELVNYIEHYGLTREHLGDGKYEHTKPRHSWNAAFKASNWLLINLQRHSDHHYKPDRRFPLLQNYGPDEAPQLPYGYPVMGIVAMTPPLWRRMMNPRVRAWRRQYYPHITDWTPYKTASNPWPR
ncbi:alkane 1-monooxygenase [Loktanella sp. 3ANDIMAR09]|uniref:alkane 1-monooxygenase n=1 Tax=Loktanella sp. 3ANDIMAR09 TaxID=1225657 RepID=UPI0006F96794|nr:alkane 1-monooxygenase [Loktanella sp. 3ANDIMAR09]KQI70205.1 alkane 1-monooxygenase [Loktanella sp. 3ANDIMAR09]